MKKILTAFFLLSFTFGFAQTETEKVQKDVLSTVHVTSVAYNVDTIEELKKIDWPSIKEAFNQNKDEDQIEMRFAIDLKKSKHKLKSSITFSGTSENIDSLIEKAQKGVKILIKIATNQQKQ